MKSQKVYNAKITHAAVSLPNCNKSVAFKMTSSFWFNGCITFWPLELTGRCNYAIFVYFHFVHQGTALIDEGAGGTISVHFGLFKGLKTKNRAVECTRGLSGKISERMCRTKSYILEGICQYNLNPNSTGVWAD